MAAVRSMHDRPRMARYPKLDNMRSIHPYESALYREHEPMVPLLSFPAWTMRKRSGPSVPEYALSAPGAAYLSDSSRSCRARAVPISGKSRQERLTLALTSLSASQKLLMSRHAALSTASPIVQPRPTSHICAQSLRHNMRHRPASGSLRRSPPARLWSPYTLSSNLSTVQ